MKQMKWSKSKEHFKYPDAERYSFKFFKKAKSMILNGVERKDMSNKHETDSNHENDEVNLSNNNINHPLPLVISTTSSTLTAKLPTRIIDTLQTVEYSLLNEGITELTYTLLSNLPNNISSLNLHGNHLTSLKNLSLIYSKLTHLTELNISSNHILSADLPELAYLPMLSSLDLSGNQLKSIYNLPFLPSLIQLHIAYNKIDNLYGIHENCPNIQYIDVRSNRLTRSEDIYPIKLLQDIQSIDFGFHNTFLNVTSNPICETIHQTNDTKKKNVTTMTTKIIINLFDSCKTLETIDGISREEWDENILNNVIRESIKTPIFDKIKERMTQLALKQENNILLNQVMTSSIQPFTPILHDIDIPMNKRPTQWGKDENIISTPSNRTIFSNPWNDINDHRHHHSDNNYKNKSPGKVNDLNTRSISLIVDNQKIDDNQHLIEELQNQLEQSKNRQLQLKSFLQWKYNVMCTKNSRILLSQQKELIQSHSTNDIQCIKEEYENKIESYERMIESEKSIHMNLSKRLSQLELQLAITKKQSMEEFRMVEREKENRIEMVKANMMEEMTKVKKEAMDEARKEVINEVMSEMDMLKDSKNRLEKELEQVKITYDDIYNQSNHLFEENRMNKEKISDLMITIEESMASNIKDRITYEDKIEIIKNEYEKKVISRDTEYTQTIRSLIQQINRLSIELNDVKSNCMKDMERMKQIFELNREEVKVTMDREKVMNSKLQDRLLRLQDVLNSLKDMNMKLENEKVILKKTIYDLFEEMKSMKQQIKELLLHQQQRIDSQTEEWKRYHHELKRSSDQRIVSSKQEIETRLREEYQQQKVSFELERKKFYEQQLQHYQGMFESMKSDLQNKMKQYEKKIEEESRDKMITYQMKEKNEWMEKITIKEKLLEDLSMQRDELKDRLHKVIYEKEEYRKQLEELEGRYQVLIQEVNVLQDVLIGKTSVDDHMIRLLQTLEDREEEREEDIYNDEEDRKYILSVQQSDLKGKEYLQS